MVNIEDIKKEYKKVVEDISNPDFASDIESLLNKKDSLEKIISEEKELKERIQECKLLIDGKEGPEMTSMAEEELSQLQEKQNDLQKRLESLVKEPKESAIMEIRAGTGGEEAALFAQNLFRMYLKYAQKNKWAVKILDSRPTELGGLKEIIFEIKDGFSKLKYEGGVHRVQRIPETEKSGRVHTSTATVAVLQKPKKSQIKMSKDDLRIDVYRASGPGGQYVNRRETAVRITHLPTGIVVTSQAERSQLKNKESAMAILEVRLLEKQREQEHKGLDDKRKSQIGSAKRAEKIRTYNFPQDRVTDHRIKKSMSNIESIMDGELDKIIDALQKSSHAF